MCRFLFFLSCLMSIALCLIGKHQGIHSDLSSTFWLSVSDSYLLCLLACILKPIRLGWIVNVGVCVLLYSELFVVFFYHSFVNCYIVQFILNTDRRESSEFISSVILSQETIIAFLLFAFFVGIVLLLIKATKKNFMQKRWCVCALGILVVWSCVKQYKYSVYEELNRCFRAQDYMVFIENFPRLETPYVRVLHGIAYNSFLSGQELETLVSSVSATTVGSCSFRCPFILLVIGESYNKHRSSLYNKNELPNTPRLQGRVETGNLVLYDDVVAPYNNTQLVLRNVFSMWDDSCTDSWASHSLFTAIFKKAGYNVYFVTNQFTVNSRDRWNNLGGTLFNNFKLSELQFTGRNTYEHQFDLELLEDIPDSVALFSKPTLLIVHLLGQHVVYDDRFPAEFNRFSPSQVTAGFGGEEGRKITADYMNATYYNDFVVDSLFRMFDRQDMIAIYLSDHGEEVYDWRNKYNRTGEADLLPQIARYQYEIPFMFLMTDTFQKRHPDIADDVRNNAGKPFITNNLSDVLLHLGGISAKDYHEENDVLSPNYKTKRKRIIRDAVDYDELMGKTH